jgi:hypothetical protein
MYQVGQQNDFYTLMTHRYLGEFGWAEATDGNETERRGILISCARSVLYTTGPLKFALTDNNDRGLAPGTGALHSTSATERTASVGVGIGGEWTCEIMG